MTEHRPQRSVLFLPFSYQPQFHEGVARYAGSHGWHLNADMVRTGRIPYGWQGDGILTLLNEDAMAARMVLQYDVPVVDMAMIQADLPLARVSKDNFLIGQAGARHFLEQGWHHYAFFSREFNNTCRLRLAGFRQEVEQHGYTCREIILNPFDRVQGDHWDAVRQWLVEEIRGMPKPLAIMGFSDYEAAVVMDACISGKFSIPDEVGVLGVDDMEVICLCQPVPLSSVQSRAAEVGYRAAELLEKLMIGGKPHRGPILIPPGGISQRQSTNRLVLRNPRLAQAIKIMSERLDAPISMEMLAREVGITRLGLYKIFQRELHQTPTEFLRRKRLRMAREMLLNSGESIGAISKQCGMPVLSTFIRQFKLETGVRPGEWRRKMKGTLPAG